jgi:four helix bundle protein
MRNFRDYEVWQRAVKLARVVYQLSGQLPPNEKYGLCSQIQRAAVSIASNIAEGSSRTSANDFKRFLEMSEGSAFELETHLIIIKEIGVIKDLGIDPIINEIHIVQKQLNLFIKAVKG